MEDLLIDITIDEPTSPPEPEKCSHLRELVSAFRKVEEECFEAVKDLLEENKQLREENMSLKSQLVAKDEGAVATLEQKQEASEFKQQIESLGQQLKEARLSMETAPFVLVLIDGNAHTFTDSLLRGGALGGSDAAGLLHDEITARIQQYGDARDWKIVTKLYLDFGNLLMHDKGVRGHREAGLRELFAGFTQFQLGFDVIDTGRGLDEAKSKIAGMLDLFVSNVQCKHIFYACAPDAHALSSLDHYRNNFIVASSITLIKSKAFEDSNVYLPFEIIEIPALFRGIQQSSEENEVSNFARTRHSESHERSRTNPSMRRFKSHASSAPVFGSWGPEGNLVLLNIDGQRVDSRLDQPSPEAIESFNKRTARKKVCLWHHLNGSCLNETHCQYDHDPPLYKDQMQVLRLQVRRNPCDLGSSCRRTCFFGHLCPDIYCAKGSRCKFSHVHGVNRVAVHVYSGNEDTETSTSTLTETSSDSASEASVTPRKETQRSASNRMSDQRSSILAPHNPNVPEDQPKSKIEEEREAAEGPYIKLFERRNGNKTN